MRDPVHVFIGGYDDRSRETEVDSETAGYLGPLIHQRTQSWDRKKRKGNQKWRYEEYTGSTPSPGLSLEGANTRRSMA
jgi:hypothetical protein